MDHAGQEPRQIDCAQAPHEVSDVAFVLPAERDRKEPDRPHDCPLDCHRAIGFWQHDVKSKFAPVNRYEVGKHDKETPLT